MTRPHFESAIPGLRIIFFTRYFLVERVLSITLPDDNTNSIKLIIIDAEIVPCVCTVDDRNLKSISDVAYCRPNQGTIAVAVAVES